VELRERGVRHGGALAAQIRDGDPRRRIDLLDGLGVVEVAVVGE